MQIKKATLGDERILAGIQVQSWRSAFAGIIPEEVLQQKTDISRIENMYRHALGKEELHLFIVTDEGMPMGMAGWSHDRGGRAAAELVCIHCLPHQKRKGYGSALIQHVIGEMQSAGYTEASLWVFTQNHAARCFYEKQGFRQTELRKDAFGAEEMMYSRKL